jgi:hypothetical protein
MWKLIGIRSIKEAAEAALEKEEGWSSSGNNSDGGDPGVCLVSELSSQAQRRHLVTDHDNSH